MPGTVTFSLEIELGWGVVQYGKLDVLSPERRAETKALDQLLHLCDDLQIPISFNIVGHLMRDGPLPSYEAGHTDGWFDEIPLKNPEENPEFYARDLVERIESARINHEICTHTFTHVECANESRETLRWEFDRVLDTHDDLGLKRPDSLVPPRHSQPSRNILKEYSIGIVRSPRSRAPKSSEASNRLQLGKNVVTGKQPIVRPRIVDDIVETYCTRYPSLTAPFLRTGQKQPHSIFQIIPVSLRKRLNRRNMSLVISNVIEQNSYVHFWSHLWEMANDDQWSVVERCLRGVANAKDNNDVQIRTMENLNQIMRS